MPWLAGDIVATLLFRKWRDARFRAFLWLANHPGRIGAKRRAIQRERKVSDNEVIRFMAPASRPLSLYFKAVGMGALGSAVGPTASVAPHP